jgi:hypothetical protein
VDEAGGPHLHHRTRLRLGRLRFGGLFVRRCHCEVSRSDSIEEERVQLADRRLQGTRLRWEEFCSAERAGCTALRRREKRSRRFPSGHSP